MRRLKKGILSAGSSFFLLSILPAVFLWSGSGFAAEETAQSLAVKVANLERNLTAIEKNQKDLLQKQEEILQKLDNLKIWVRRY